MKNTLNLNSFIQRFKSLSGKKTLANVVKSIRSRAAFLTLLALALALLAGFERLDAMGKAGKGGYVQIQPDAVTLNQGATFQLRAAVLNPLGFVLPNSKVKWKSGNKAIARVDKDTGLVTAVAPGIVTITAKSGAAEGAATITVNGIVTPPPNTAPTVAITEPTDGATFQQGAAITFTATATDMEEGDLSAQIVWTSAVASDPNAVPTPLGTGASVTTASLAPGSYLITARATDSGGLFGVAQVGITVNAPCSIVVGLQPSSGSKVPQLLQLDATLTRDTCGRTLKYYWGCASDSSDKCPDFLVAANGNDNTNRTPILNLDEFVTVGIGLFVCVAGTNGCTLPPPDPFSGIYSVLRLYEGAAVNFGASSSEGKGSEVVPKSPPTPGANFQRK